MKKIKFNPTLGVKKLTIRPRQHYAEDRDYEFMLKIAQESNYWYLWPAMEIAYLCRMRLSEVLDLTDANELPAGPLIKRRKGSRDNITEWNPRLRTAWDFAVATRNRYCQIENSLIRFVPRIGISLLINVPVTKA